MNSTRYHLNLQIAYTICLNKYGVDKLLLYCDMNNECQIPSYPTNTKVRSVRSSETIVQMHVFASSQLPKLSGEKQHHFTFSHHSLFLIIINSLVNNLTEVNKKITRNNKRFCRNKALHSPFMFLHISHKQYPVAINNYAYDGQQYPGNNKDHSYPRQICQDPHHKRTYAKDSRSNRS